MRVKFAAEAEIGKEVYTERPGQLTFQMNKFNLWLPYLMINNWNGYMTRPFSVHLLSSFLLQQQILPAYEPQHDKTNKVTVRPPKTQISPGICPVWSESSLCAQWVAKDPSCLHADSEDSDQSRKLERRCTLNVRVSWHFRWTNSTCGYHIWW